MDMGRKPSDVITDLGIARVYPHNRIKHLGIKKEGPIKWQDLVNENKSKDAD